MATTTVYATSFISGTVSTPSNALNAPDGVFTTDTDNTNWNGTWGWDNLAGTLTGSQQGKLYVRKGSSGGNDPTIDTVYVLVNGSIVGASRASATVTSATSQEVLFSFNSTEISTFSNVSVEVNVTGTGGKPADRRTVQIDALEFFLTYNPPVAGTNINYWDGSAWIAKPLKRWDGSAWVAVTTLKRWDGSAWVAV